MRRGGIFIVVGALVLVSLGLIVWLRPDSAPQPVANQPAPDEQLFPAGGPRDLPKPDSPAPANPTAPTPIENEFDASSPLRRLTNKPVAGAGLISFASTTAVVYAEQDTGHLYAALGGPAPLRLSNTTLPKLTRAIIGADGSTLILLGQTGQRVNLLATTTLPVADWDFLAAADVNNFPPLTITNLPPGSEQIALAPQTDRFFSLNAGAGNSNGNLYQLRSGKTEVIFESPLREWLVTWPASTIITLQTKPAHNAASVLYFLNPQTQKLTRVLGGITGLSTLVAPSGEVLLYTGLVNNELVSGIYQISAKQFRRLNLKTIVGQKCAFGADSRYAYCAVPQALPPALYPDDWYSGEIQFADNLWQIDTTTGRATILFNAELAKRGDPFDATNLLVAPDEKMIYFINKRDGQLWSFAPQTDF